MVQPALLQLVNPNGLKAECGRCADLQLSVDLGGQLACRIAICADARTKAATVFKVGELPCLAPQIRAHFANTKRSGLAHERVLSENIPATKSATNGVL
jgi:hypothetical protein